MIKVGGVSSLARYAGWSRTVPHRAHVDAMIAQFEQEVAVQLDAFVPTAEQTASVEALRTLVGEHRNLFLA